MDKVNNGTYSNKGANGSYNTFKNEDDADENGKECK